MARLTQARNQELVPPERPACYARISQDRIGESIGVADQVNEAKAYAARHGWPEPAVYSDNDISASSTKRRRPHFERLLSDIESGAVDGLVVRHLDRLLRQVLDLERVLNAIESDTAADTVQVVLLEGGNIDLTSASGRLLARILTSVAASESEIKVERLLQARHRDAQAGKAHQALGYGYDRLTKAIIKSQAEVIREVADRLLEDGEGWGSIAADLNERRVPTAWADKWTGKSVESVDSDRGRISHPDLYAVVRLLRATEPVDPAALASALRAAGSSWHVSDVRARPEAATLADPHVALTTSQAAQLLGAAGIARPASGWNTANLRTMMSRGALCGWRDHKGEMVAQGDWDPILDKEQVERIRAMIRTGGRPTEVRHLLSGFLVCGRCGSKMRGGFSEDPRLTGRRGGKTWRYACPRRRNKEPSGCGLSVAGEELDDTVSGWLLGALADTDFRERGYTRKDDPRVGKAIERLAGYSDTAARFSRMWRDGTLDDATYEENMTVLKQRENADRAMVDAAAPRTEVLRVLEEAPKDTDDLLDWWASKDLIGKRSVLRTLIASIPLAPSPTGKGRGTPPVERLGEPVWRV